MPAACLSQPSCMAPCLSSSSRSALLPTLPPALLSPAAGTDLLGGLLGERPLTSSPSGPLFHRWFTGRQNQAVLPAHTAPQDYTPGSGLHRGRPCSPSPPAQHSRALRTMWMIPVPLGLPLCLLHQGQAHSACNPPPPTIHTQPHTAGYSA